MPVTWAAAEHKVTPGDDNMRARTALLAAAALLVARASSEASEEDVDPFDFDADDSAELDDFGDERGTYGQQPVAAGSDNTNAGSIVFEICTS